MKEAREERMADNKKDDVPNDAEAEAARALAEARRQRIMDKASSRMGLVSGEVHVSEDQKQASQSKAARIRAARAKRYGKKATPAPASSATSSDEAHKQDEVKKEEAPKKEEEVKETTPSPEVEEDSETVATSATSASKKKYVGVAKMRRNKILKKKLEQQESGDDLPMPTNVPASILKQPKAPKWPIYFHIFTVVLLFMAGLDVGLQQPSVVKEEQNLLLIHGESSLMQYGIPIVHRDLGAYPTKNEDEKFLLENDHGVAGDGGEFDDIGDDDDDINEPNIDPLFGVDLDELTKGPGIFMQLARGAVAMHRVILFVFFYKPKSIFNTLLGIPASLLQNPPILCLCALVIRQVVGKVILGAHIPDPVNTEVTPKDDGVAAKLGNLDPMGMAKNFVKNSLPPMLVSAYSAFTHLRADMYIVICGVFCGLVWSQYLNEIINPLIHEAIASSGLFYEKPEVVPEAEVGTDEL